MPDNYVSKFTINDKELIVKDSEARNTANTASTNATNALNRVTEYKELLLYKTNELNRRISTIIADGQQTEGNTELIDIRTGADGKVYPTAGDAVRVQIGALSEGNAELKEEMTYCFQTSIENNLFNFENKKEGYYVAYDNGHQMRNDQYCYAICKISENAAYFINCDNVHIAFYKDIVDVSRVNAESYISGVVLKRKGIFKTPDNANLCTISIAIADLEKVVVKRMLAKNIITVGDGDFDFNEIQDALEIISDDSVSNPYTILVFPKTYKRIDVRSEQGRYISIIGTDKERCIVKSTSGKYKEPAGNIQVTGIIKNITFISTHDNISELPDGDMGSYAVHADFFVHPSPYDMTFENCKFISYQTAGYGGGMRENCKVTLRECEFYNLAPDGFNTTQSGDYPSLVIHSALEEVGNQSVVVENCKGYSLTTSKCIQIYRYKGYGEMNLEFRNNSFYSKVAKTSAQIDGTISPLSFGNNVEEMNYKENS